MFAGATTLALGGFVAFAVMRYQIAKPSQYVVRTGIMIDKVTVDKKAFQWPFQTAKMISVQPSNYMFDLQAMSREKMEFILPGVYTIGPKDEPKALVRYATLLSNTSESQLTSIIKGIIEGETRVLTASLSLEEIFSGRDEFRDHVTHRIDKELDKLGLVIHNANIQEMSDHAGSEYFQFLRQRARANAENEARINIANAQKDGDIAVKDRERETRIRTSEFESNAVTFENERNVEIAESNAKLKVHQAEFKKMSEIARIEAEKASEIREMELLKEVETRRIAQQQEHMRSELLVKAKVEAEAKERTADADLYAKKAEAAGVLARFNAEAEGLRQLFEGCDNPDIVMQYLMLDRNLYPELAKAMADAIRGMNPKINYWNTGGEVGNPISDVLKNVPASVDMLKTTGITPPSWLMGLKDGMPMEKQTIRNKQ
jgi:flotillin